jgi:hypothetical protein
MMEGDIVKLGRGFTITDIESILSQPYSLAPKTRYLVVTNGANLNESFLSLVALYSGFKK